MLIKICACKRAHMHISKVKPCTMKREIPVLPPIQVQSPLLAPILVPDQLFLEGIETIPDALFVFFYLIIHRFILSTWGICRATFGAVKPTGNQNKGTKQIKQKLCHWILWDNVSLFSAAQLTCHSGGNEWGGGHLFKIPLPIQFHSVCACVFDCVCVCGAKCWFSHV